jgi:hypothetical protein
MRGGIARNRQPTKRCEDYAKERRDDAAREANNGTDCLPRPRGTCCGEQVKLIVIDGIDCQCGFHATRNLHSSLFLCVVANDKRRGSSVLPRLQN